MCCFIDAVPDIGKPANQACIFCRSDHCAVYSTRPRTCSEFECEWLKGNLPRWMKPNRIHLMVERMPGVDVVLVLPEDGHERNWRTDKIVNVLKKQYFDKGMAVVGSDNMGMVPEGKTPTEVAADINLAARRILGLAPR